MELKIKKEELGDLVERSKEFLKYERFYNINSVFCILWFFIPIIIANQVLTSLTIYENAVLLLLGLALAVGSVLVLSRKKGEYRVKDIEWVKLYSFAIHNSLVDYFGTNSAGLKKKSRQYAVNYGESLLYAVRQRWEVGSFSLVERCQKAVTDFRKNLKTRVVPALQSGDDDKLRRVRSLTYNLFYKSDKLVSEDLETVNKEMSTEDSPLFLKSSEPKITYHRVLDLIKDKRIRPYLPPLVISSVAAGVVFIFLTNYYGSNPVIAGASIALFVGLLAFLRPTNRGQGY